MPKSDKEEFLKKAAEAEAQGDSVLAGIMRVEAHNDRSNHRKRHKPNLGPYNSDNPKHCMDCHKPGDDWVKGEECVPQP